MAQRYIPAVDTSRTTKVIETIFSSLCMQGVSITPIHKPIKNTTDFLPYGSLLLVAVMIWGSNFGFRLGKKIEYSGATGYFFNDG